MTTIQLRSRLPLLPTAAEIVSPDLAVVREEGKVVLFNAAGPIYECRQDDGVGLRLAVAITAGLHLAPITALAAAFGVDRGTVHRDYAKLEAGGVGALQPRKRGPKGPHKLNAAALGSAQRALDAGESLRETGKKVGGSHFAIHHAIQRGLLTRPSKP